MDTLPYMFIYVNGGSIQTERHAPDANLLRRDVVRYPHHTSLQTSNMKPLSCFWVEYELMINGCNILVVAHVYICLLIFLASIYSGYPPPRKCAYCFQIDNIVHTFYTQKDNIIIIFFEANIYLNLLIYQTSFIITNFCLHFQDDV